MKINDRMLGYLEQAIDERLDKMSVPELDADYKIRLKSAWMKQAHGHDPDLLRALELACADLEAHTITPSAEDMEAFRKWNVEEKAKRVKKGWTPQDFVNNNGDWECSECEAIALLRGYHKPGCTAILSLSEDEHEHNSNP